VSTGRTAASALGNIGWRYLWFHRWQSLLMVLGIALGVAVVISIDLANAGAAKAFELSTETVTGKATHQVEGGVSGLEEGLYARLRVENPAYLAAPVISEYATSPQLDGQPMQLLGIDPFADAPFRSFLGQAGSVDFPGLEELSLFLTRPGAVLLSRPLAERFGLEPGNELELVVGGYTRKAFVAGVLVPANSLSQRTLDGLILADISTAQELTGMEGRLSRIDLLLPAGDAQKLERLSGWLPSGVRVVPSSARTGSIRQMTAAFQTNLTMLSLLALVVGLFLIYNTMTFSVVQRRGLFGTLRCLGVTREEVFFLVVGEAVIVGILGGLVGILLGGILGQFTVGMVTQTVNDLYFTTTVRAVGIDPLSLVKGALLGLLASVFTAALPAWEAASVPPRAALLRSNLESKARRTVGKAGLAGFLSGGAGCLVFLIPTANLLVGFTGTLLVVVGFALLSSAALVLLMRAVVPLTSRLFGLIGRMAPRSLVNSLSRTAVAVAALMVAVAVTIGVGLMIDSFRATVVLWLGQTLQSDVYISVPSFNATRASSAIDPQAVEIVNSWPGVERVDTLRSISADTPVGPANLAATDNPDLGSERMFASLSVKKNEVWPAMQAGAVIVSEPLANRLAMKRAGGEMEIETPLGRRTFHVIGIYYDYASSEGTVMLSLEVYRDLWQDEALTALGLQLAPGVDPDAVTRGLQEALKNRQQLLIRPNQVLRQDVLEVFDRTFAITMALRVLATVVAFIGILNALLLLQLEKQREVGILRALGLTGQQLWQMVMLETGLMGLVAGLLSMPAGYALAVILIYVINRRSFGWTLHLEVHPAIFIQAMAVAMAAALLAGVYPAYKMGRMSTAEVIRNE
jgi:putative ABC transport system permease protein